MNHQSHSLLRFAAQPAPVRALRDDAGSVPAAGRASASASAGMGRLLGRLLSDESVLYAITREWRYDAHGRKFTRIHALLDEQFAEIGVRLVQLAARIQAPGPRASTGPGKRAKPFWPLINDGALEAHMLRELLALHEAMLVHLRSGKSMAITQLYHVATIDLLTDLIAAHEKDAFMLRALLWEVQNTAA